MRGYRKRDAHQKEWRTSSKGVENKFKRSGEQVQKERRTSSKFAEMRISFSLHFAIGTGDWSCFLPQPFELTLSKKVNAVYNKCKRFFAAFFDKTSPVYRSQVIEKMKKLLREVNLLPVCCIYINRGTYSCKVKFYEIMA